MQSLSGYVNESLMLVCLNKLNLVLRNKSVGTSYAKLQLLYICSKYGIESIICFQIAIQGVSVS